MFTSEKYNEARTSLVQHICVNMLFIDPSKVIIYKVRSNKENKSRILYLKSDPKFIRELFVRAALVKDPNIRLIPYTPAGAIQQKQALE